MTNRVDTAPPRSGIGVLGLAVIALGGVLTLVWAALLLWLAYRAWEFF